MFHKLINYLLIASFLLCYMEWGGENSAFVYEVHYEVFSSGRGVIDNLMHPVILFGLSGELCVIYAQIRRKTFSRVNNIGVVLITLVVLVLLTAGLFSLNFRMMASNVPFLALAVAYYYRAIGLRRERRRNEGA